jgi:hypothetical protein
MCGVNIELSHEIFLLLLEGHLRKVLQGFVCNHIHPKAGLAFLVGNAVAALGINLSIDCFANLV